jgi:formylglycine-generating enzyme required for sulfatase activity
LPLLGLLAGCGGNGTPEAKGEMPKIITTKSGVDMVVIPAGYFEMGYAHGRDDEKPVHKVWIDSFLMDKYEVTQSEYESLGKEEDPPFVNPSHFRGANLPVEQINWLHAANFCNARSKVEGLKPCYNDSGECDFEADGYRLPTEAEWEYACRAGTDTSYSFGSDAKKLDDFAWLDTNSGKKTHPVGQKQANPWGLFDMHGNVAEWCHDIYEKDYYGKSPDKNPRGPAAGPVYVLRGGSWTSKADGLRSTYRLGANPGFADACLARDAIGFRCVRKAPSQ